MDVGDKAATDTAFANAHHVSRVEIPFARVAIKLLEPRAAIGEYDRFEDRYTLHSGNQFPHDLRAWMAQSVLNIPESKLRIISPDMGGSFGLRSSCFPELTLVLGRPNSSSRLNGSMNVPTAFSKSMPAIFIWRSNLP